MIDYELNEQGVATITLNRPEKYNAFDDQLIASFIKILKEISNNPNVLLVNLQAQGKHFCSGADLSWMQRMVRYTEQENLHDSLQLAELMELFYTLPQPTLASIHGAVYGGGVGLVACCDIAIASLDAKFGFSEVKLGLIPAVISPYIIKAIGARQTQRYFLTAETFDSKKAYEMGLIHQYVDINELPKTVENIIQTILSNSSEAVYAAKQLIHDVRDQNITKDLLKDTATRIAKMRVSEEAQSRLKRFLQHDQ
ncbi:MAG: enoyl-CoA hydratase-related protein [Gammaproteobacteria bacterium]